jgi:hypothetical protein
LRCNILLPLFIITLHSDAHELLFAKPATWLERQAMILAISFPLCRG